MADPPGQLSLERHRDLARRGFDVWVRRALLVALLAFPVAALLDVFGESARTARATGPAATLEVRSPTDIRGGLLFQARITVRAARTIDQPKLVLASGWIESLTLNTTEPQATQEASEDGRLTLSYDRLAAGHSLIVWLQFQANPDNLGSQDQDVAVYDGATRVASLNRTLTVFP